MGSNADVKGVERQAFNTSGNVGLRRAGVAAGLVAVFLSMVMVWPAHGQGVTSATCSATLSVRTSPGLTLFSGSDAVTTGGETGSIICVGTFNGHGVTGPGSIGLMGTIVGTCLADSGSGTYSFTIATDAGPMHFAGTFKESSVGPIGPVEAFLPGAHYRGIEVFVPTHGDCVTTPATEILLSTTGMFQTS